MTTWQTMLGVDGPPVRGQSGEFSVARRRFEDMESDAQRVVDGFAALVDIGSHPDRLRGGFTRTLQTAFSGVDEGLKVLPRVASEAATVFGLHHSSLVSLREQADRAFDRAVAAWNTKQDLERSAAQLEAQMPSLGGVALDDLDDVHRRRDQIGSQLSSVNSRIDAQQAILDRIEGEWSELRIAEDQCDGRTADRLGGIDLGVLDDPGFWERVGNAVGDFLGAVGDIATALIDGAVELFAKVVDLLTEAWERMVTLADYAIQTGVRRWRNPLQSMWDLLTLTIPLEDVSAALAILVDGGQLYDDGPYCGTEASCIVGTWAPDGAAAITLGHTVLYTDPNPPAWGTDERWDGLVAHEMQHVYDIESVGGLPFYVTYGGDYVVRRMLGRDHDTAYREIWWEERAYAVSRGEREPQGLWRDVWEAVTARLPDLPPPRPPHGPFPNPSFPPVISGPWNPLVPAAR